MRILSVVLVSFLTATCGQKGQLDIPGEESSTGNTVQLCSVFVDGKCSLLDSVLDINGSWQQ